MVELLQTNVNKFTFFVNNHKKIRSYKASDLV
jgi:hypothetical protein